MHLTARHMAVAGGEALAHAAESQAYFGRHARGIFLNHTCLIAPGKELGVLRHIGDQRVHLLGAVPDENGLVDTLHRIGTVCALSL